MRMDRFYLKWYKINKKYNIETLENCFISYICIAIWTVLEERAISRIMIWKVTLPCRCNSLLFRKLFAARPASRKHSSSFIVFSHDPTWLSSFSLKKEVLLRCDQKTHIIGRWRKLLSQERLFDCMLLCKTRIYFFELFSWQFFE
jgi:hypothetical protein